MDILDVTDEMMEHIHAARIDAIRHRRGPVATGRCFYCTEPVPPRHLFCDADCRDDHEKEQAARQRKGMI